MHNLDQRNKELAKMLFSLKQSIEAEKLLGLNAEQINKKGIGKRFFVHSQMILIESCVANVCKIFELEKEYPLNSIPGILKLIKKENIECISQQPLNEFIDKYGRNIGKSNFVSTMECICKEFYFKHKVSFNAYEMTRNKVIAHSETGAEKESLPSYATINEILSFGVDFYCMINKGFLGVGPCFIHKDTQVFSSLNTLLEKSGYCELKQDFDK